METAPWIDVDNISINESIINNHISILHALRNTAFEKSSHESTKMVNKHLAKYPPGQYNNGDQVYIKVYGKDERLKRGGKSVKAPRVFEGMICKCDPSNYRYKVEFTNHTGQKTKEWIKVNDITSRSYEKEKQKKAKAKSRPTVPVKTVNSSFKIQEHSQSRLRDNYKQMQKIIFESIQLRRNEDDRQSNLLENANKLSLEINSNNPEGENCMFYALSHQLLTHGIDISHKRIRKRIVDFLSTNPSLRLGTGRTVNFEDFISHRYGWNSYLSELSMDGTWGDYLTLIAAANVFSIRITVVSSIPDAPVTVIKPVETSRNINIYLDHLHELHYISLIPMEENRPEELCHILWTDGTKHKPYV